MKLIVAALCTLLTCCSFAQTDTTLLVKIKALDTANSLKTDTIAVPDDRLTQKVKKLRTEKQGLNLETVVLAKIQEESAKDTTRPKEFYTKLITEVTSGHTGKLMENSLINLYRNRFTESEIDELTRFYKTAAGKKLNQEFIFLIAQSVKDAEALLKLAMTKVQ